MNFRLEHYVSPSAVVDGAFWRRFERLRLKKTVTDAAHRIRTSLTFEVSRTQRRNAWPTALMMHCIAPWAKCFAVGARLERGVRQQCGRVAWCVPVTRSVISGAAMAPYNGIRILWLRDVELVVPNGLATTVAEARRRAHGPADTGATGLHLLLPNVRAKPGPTVKRWPRAADDELHCSAGPAFCRWASA